MKIWKPIKNGQEHEHYFTKFEVRRKQYFRCLFTPEKKEAERRAKRLQAKARAGQFEEAGQEQSQPAPDLLLGDVMKVYEKEIVARAGIDERTVRGNLAAMRLIAREMFGTQTPDLVPLTRFTGAAVRTWMDARVASAQRVDKSNPEKRSPETVKASVNSALRQGGSLFSKQALMLYGDRGLKLPDMSGLTARFAVKKDDTFVPFSPSALAKLDEAIARRRDEDAGMWLVLMLARKLGLRSKEIQHVRRDWFEQWPDGVRLAVIKRDGEFEPKGRPRRVPVPPELYASLMEVAGEDYLVEAPHKTGREDMVNRTTNEWLRTYMPGREKKLHELRKQAGSEHLMQHKDMTMTRDWLGHASITTTEKHYASLLVPIKALA